MKIKLTVLGLMFVLSMVCAKADSVLMANPSFELFAIDPNTNPFYAIPFVYGWTEEDIDPEPEYGGRNTGVFLNTEPNKPDHIVNVDGRQAAFLGNYQGNAIWQILEGNYQPGKSYKLTVGVCVSLTSPPAGNNPLTIALQYWDPNDPSSEPNMAAMVDIATTQISAAGLTANRLVDFSVDVPTVETDSAWAGQPICIAIRASGFEGGFWDLDHVRATEYPLRPDLDGDHFVNYADFSRLAAEWLSCEQTSADLTGDGCVDMEDLLILSEDWLTRYNEVEPE